MWVLGGVWVGCWCWVGCEAWVREYLQEQNPSVSEIQNPCQIRGEDAGWGEGESAGRGVGGV